MNNFVVLPDKLESPAWVVKDDRSGFVLCRCLLRGNAITIAGPLDIAEKLESIVATLKGITQ